MFLQFINSHIIIITYSLNFDAIDVYNVDFNLLLFLLFYEIVLLFSCILTMTLLSPVVIKERNGFHNKNKK